MWAISQGPVAHLSANHITSQIASSWKSEAWWSYLQSGKSIGLAGRFAFLCWPKENLKKGGQPQLARILTSRNIYRGDCRFAASFSFLFLRVLHSVAGKRIAFSVDGIPLSNHFKNHFHSVIFLAKIVDEKVQKKDNVGQKLHRKHFLSLIGE